MYLKKRGKPKAFKRMGRQYNLQKNERIMLFAYRAVCFSATVKSLYGDSGKLNR